MVKQKANIGFSLTPKKRVKSQNKRIVMARKTFTTTSKSEVNGNPELIQLVSLLASEQSKAVRKTFNYINNHKGEEPKDKSIKDWGFDSTEARNIIKIAKGIYDSQASLFSDVYISDVKSNIRSLKAKIKSVKVKLNKAKKDSRAKKLRKSIFYLNNKLNKNQQRFQSLIASLESAKFSVCFGAKNKQRQFTRNLNLAKVSTDISDSQAYYSEYQRQLSQWQFNRDSEVFYEGHAVQKAGNQKIKLIPTEDGLFDIAIALKGDASRIAVPKRLQNKVSTFAKIKNNFVVFSKINFGSTRNYFDLISALTPIITEETNKNGKTTKRTSTKYPISPRLKLVVDKYGEVGVVVITTIKLDKAAIATNRNNGCLGVDLNQHSLDWCVVDPNGNYKQSGSIHLSTQDRNHSQTKDAVYKTTKQLLLIAKKYGVIVSLEDLQFKRNSESFTSTKFARMASNLPYTLIRDAITQQSFRLGVTVKFVNPAFTSVIGLYKYMAPLGLNSGTSAGLVIARRGLGLRDKIPQYVLNADFTLDDGISATSWAAWGRLAKWHKTVGRFNRHKFYSLSRSHRVNCSHEDVFNTPSVASKSTK